MAEASATRSLAERFEPLQDDCGTSVPLPTQPTRQLARGWQPFLLVAPQSGAGRAADSTAHPESCSTDEQTARSSNDPLQAPPVVFLPQPAAPSQRTELLEYLEGTVVQVTEGQFVARFRDLLDATKPELTGALALDEVPDADRRLVAPGAVFYWGIGYRVEAHGQKTTQSSIRFRRLPVWTKRELARAEEHAREFDAFFVDRG